MPNFWHLTIKSNEYVDSQAKIFLILYPPLENFTTRTAIGQYAQYQPFSSSKTELALSEKSLTCRDLLDNKNKENLKIKMSLHIEQPKKTRPKFKESALKVNTYSLLICTWVLKNRVRPTGFLASKNQFWNWFLQATQAIIIYVVCWTWFFKDR